MSFLIDPALLTGAGAAIERLDVSDTTADWLERSVTATFVAGSLGLYLNHRATRWMWELCGAESGRDWMLNSGVFDIDHERAGWPTHAVAAALFATYPLWPRLGRRLAGRDGPTDGPGPGAPGR